MKAMLLCAGEGTRLRPFTALKPKPLIPFLGVPMVEYCLELLEDLNIDSYVVNKHHLPGQIEKYFLDSGLRVDFSDESDALLGSAGGIRKAQPYLDGDDFFVLNADEVILSHSSNLLSEMLKFHNWHGGLATLLTTPHPEVGTKFGGAWCGPNNEVSMFSKPRPQDASLVGHHFIGVMLFRKDLFEFFVRQSGDENIFYETLTAAMKAGEKVFCHPCVCEWIETGNPNDFLNGTESILTKFNQTNQLDSDTWKAQLSRTILRVPGPTFAVEADRPDLIAKIQALHKTVRT